MLVQALLRRPIAILALGSPLLLCACATEDQVKDAMNAAQHAQSTADQALSTANDASGKADKALQRADEANQKADAAFQHGLKK